MGDDEEVARLVAGGNTRQAATLVIQTFVASLQRTRRGGADLGHQLRGETRAQTCLVLLPGFVADALRSVPGDTERPGAERRLTTEVRDPPPHPLAEQRKGVVDRALVPE